MDRLIEDVRGKSREWQDVLSGSIDAGLAEMLDPIAQENWHQLSEEQVDTPQGIVGTDGSRAERTLWNGTVWWIARAVAICGPQRTRVLESGFIRGRAAELDSEWYLSLRMEGAENTVALEGAKQFKGRLVLMDGSLLGRLQHMPIELEIPDDRVFLLVYYDRLLELLEYCRDNDIGLVGISKDSGISQFTRFMLLRRMSELMRASGERMPLEMQDAVRNGILYPDTPRGSGYSLMMRLRSSKEAQWKLAAEILRLALLPVNDHMLMQSMLKGVGYTTPIMLGLSESSRNLLRFAASNPQEYADTRFGKSIAEAPDPERFRQYARGVIARMQDLPSVVSFHVRLHPKDTPLRVDIPGWMVGQEDALWENDGPQSVDCDLTDVMRMLRGGYGGLQNYNIWQKRADEIVRLSRETVDNLYREAIEKEVGHRLEFRRSYRRVYYP